MEKRAGLVSLLVSLELHGRTLVFPRLANKSAHERKAGQAPLWHTYHTLFNLDLLVVPYSTSYPIPVYALARKKKKQKKNILEC